MLMVDFSPGGTDISDLSGNGKGVDINTEVVDVDTSPTPVADDSAIAIDLGGGPLTKRCALVRLVSTNQAANALLHVSVGINPAITLIWRNDPSLFDFDSGAALSGVSGTDGHCRIRAGSDGRVYFENRLGAAIKVTLCASGVCD
jgi:hypothetical protein